MLRPLSLAFVAVLASCASSPYSPNPDRAFEEITEFRVPHSVELVNGQPSTQPLEIGGRMIANLREWTDVAIEIARRELDLRGATFAAPADRTLEISLTNAVHDSGWWTISTTIDMHVVAGNGYEADYQGVNSSAMIRSPGHQTDGAMMRVVKEMLLDPEIVRYLSQ